MGRHQPTIGGAAIGFAAIFCFAAAGAASARCSVAADPPNPFQSLENAEKSAGKEGAAPIDLRGIDGDDTTAKLTALLTLTADEQQVLKGILAAQNKQAEAAKRDGSLSDEGRNIRLEAVYRVAQFQLFQSLTPEQILKLRVDQARGPHIDDQLRVTKLFTYDARFASLSIADASSQWGDTLKLSSEQRLALIPILESEEKQLTALAGSDATMPREENQVRVQAAMIAAERKINELLTADQKKAFDSSIVLGTAPAIANPRSALPGSQDTLPVK